MKGTILHCRIVPVCGRDPTDALTEELRGAANSGRLEIPNLTDVSYSGKVVAPYPQSLSCVCLNAMQANVGPPLNLREL